MNVGYIDARFLDSTTLQMRVVGGKISTAVESVGDINYNITPIDGAANAQTVSVLSQNTDPAEWVTYKIDRSDTNYSPDYKLLIQAGILANNGTNQNQLNIGSTIIRVPDTAVFSGSLPYGKKDEGSLLGKVISFLASSIFKLRTESLMPSLFIGALPTIAASSSISMFMSQDTNEYTTLGVSGGLRTKSMRQEKYTGGNRELYVTGNSMQYSGVTFYDSLAINTGRYRFAKITLFCQIKISAPASGNPTINVGCTVRDDGTHRKTDALTFPVTNGVDLPTSITWIFPVKKGSTLSVSAYANQANTTLALDIQSENKVLIEML